MSFENEKIEPMRSVTDVDRIIHEPARYVIMTYLFVVEKADFVFLLRNTGLTRGNLSSHLNKLEKARYVEIRKTFEGKMPHTVIKLTKNGRRAFGAYRSEMKRVLEDLPMQK